MTPAASAAAATTSTDVVDADEEDDDEEDCSGSAKAGEQRDTDAVDDLLLRNLSALGIKLV